MRYVITRNLIPGMVVASPLYNDNGQLMLAANSPLTRPLIRHIEAFKFHGVYVLDGAKDDSYKPMLDDAFRMDAIRTLKSLDIDQIVYVANAITNQVMFSADMLYDMQAVCTYDNLTYMHSVNVAQLSVMMGVAMGLDNRSLLELGQGALLHDIGKTKVDPKIIKGTHRLSAEEFDIVRKHPSYGYEMLQGNDIVPESVRLAVLHHHENEDGSGYPCRIKSPGIPLYAKIIHVADVYDALVSNRSYKRRFNPADALENLMANVGTQFDLKCVEALRDNVAIYPVGREVVLSNGIHAVVKENRRGYPTRPVVVTTVGTRIDLMSKLDVTIVRFAD